MAARAEGREERAAVGVVPVAHCDAEVESDFLRCPRCARKLKDPCRNCGKPLDPEWQLCPYCEAQVVEPTAQTPAARRGRAAAEH